VPQTLHGLLTATVERHAHRPVFVTKKDGTSYEELFTRASRLAATLAGLGVERGDRVAILFDGDVDYLVAFYGALMAGAAAVPLCPDTRTAPLVHALSHSGARVLLLDGGNLRWLDGQAESVPSLRAVIVRGEGAFANPGHVSRLSFDEAVGNGERLLDQGAGERDLAAVVYTSGTTGRPKGVMLSHRNLVANVRSIVEYLELSVNDTVGMVLPFYYVYGNSVLHTHVAVGGTIAQLGSMTFLAQVVEGLQNFRCTGFSGVPATFARLMSFSTIGNYDLSRLRYLTQAGAAMAPALAEKVRAGLPRAKLFVMYGQTEAAARLSYVPPDRLDDKTGSAGRAIPGVTLKICDPEGREVPIGEPGEVVALGDNVMLGYLDDPEATARVLRPEGLRTGDVGTMDAEGYLFLKGRESEMIKSGGHRISPLEIEQAIAKVPGVHEVAVGGVPDEGLGEAIAAFIVPDQGATLTKKAILDGCFIALSKFKMPTHLFSVPDLPKGPTGKVQRRELARWFAEARGTRIK
jgi:acyl-CoA synthetase (AMP-forming)/AMP-acid ligase II